MPSRITRARQRLNVTGKYLVELRTQRFALLPVFLLGTAFSVLAPLFWTHVEAPPAPDAAAGHENVDLYGRVVPSLSYGFTRLRAGEWPLWASDQYCGMPYFANPAHGLLQPLNLVYLFVPVHLGLALHAFLGLLLMGLSCALFLRALGAGYIASAMGGMALAFGGASATVMSRPELLGVFAWTPLLFWVVYEHSVRPRGIYVVTGGLLVAVMLAAGTPLLALVLAASAMSYGVARTVWFRGMSTMPMGSKLGSFALMALLGIALSAVQWLPYLAWLPTLASPVEAIWPSNWAGQVPSTSGELARALLLPGRGALPDMLYVGVVSLTLIPAALLRRQGRFEVVFFALSAGIWIAALLWFLDGTALTEAWKVLVFPGVFALAVLTGLGADRLLLTGRDPRSPLIWGSALLVTAAAGIALVLGPPEARGRVLVAMAVLLPFLLLRVRWMGLVCGTLLAFVLFVDLRDASSTIYQHPYTSRGEWLDDSLPALREAEALALGERVLTLPAARQKTLPANVGLLLGIPNVYGDFWPRSESQMRWWKQLDPYLRPGLAAPETGEDTDRRPWPTLLNYMGARIIVGERNLPWMDAPAGQQGVDLQYLRTLGRLSLWRNDAALPRVRLVHHWQPVAHEEAALTRLLDPAFPAKDACVVEEGGPGWAALNEALPPATGADDPAALESDAGARCELALDAPESLAIDVETAEPGILVVADTYASGWRARIDGERAPILKVNGLFRGVLVPPGNHRVTFSYRPLSVVFGLLLSGAAAILAVIWCLRAAARWMMALVRGSRDTKGPTATATESEAR